MDLLIALLICILFTIILAKSIAKNKINYLLGSIIVGIILKIYPIINQRYLGLALIIIVMYIGLLNVKNYYPIRGTLAVMAVVLISFHTFKHLSRLNIKVFGLLAFLCLIPLFITSFKLIKVKINDKYWKLIHKLAYIAFLLIYIHLIIEAQLIEKIIYSVIFLGYYGLKIIKLLKIKKTVNNT